MKAEPKGQRVKTFKHWIPQPDLTKVPTQVVVYLKADSGAFHIYDGKHMLDVCRDEAQKGYDTRLLRRREASDQRASEALASQNAVG